MHTGCDWRHPWVQLRKSVYTWVWFSHLTQVASAPPTPGYEWCTEQRPSMGVVGNSWVKVFHLCSVLQLTYGMLGIITKMHLLRHRRLAKDCLTKAAFLKGFAFFILEIELLLMGFLYCLFFSLFTPFAVLRFLLLQQSMFIVHPERILAKSMDIGTALDWMLWKGAIHSPI